MMKFIPKSEPFPDEIDVLQMMDNAIDKGELLDESSINWN